MAGLSRRSVEISNQFGLHLRVASRLVQLAQQFHSEVRVLWDGRVADGKSILDLMTLGAESGALLELEVNGPDSEDALAALCELVKSQCHDLTDGSDAATEPHAGRGSIDG